MECASTHHVPQRLGAIMLHLLHGIDPATLVGKHLNKTGPRAREREANGVVVEGTNAFHAFGLLPCIVRIGPDHVVLQQPEHLVVRGIGTHAGEAVRHVRCLQFAALAIGKAGVVMEVHTCAQLEGVLCPGGIHGPGLGQRGDHGKVTLIEAHQSFVHLCAHAVGGGLRKAQRKEAAEFLALIGIEHTAVALARCCFALPRWFGCCTSCKQQQCKK